MLSNHSTLGGGMFLMFAIFASVAVWWCMRLTEAGHDSGSRVQDQAARRWTVVALVLLVCGLLTMMGKFTPFYAAACNALPWFFEFPRWFFRIPYRL